jgi:hypothetical protein
VIPLKTTYSSQTPSLATLDLLARYNFSGMVDGLGLTTVKKDGNVFVISFNRSGDETQIESQSIQIRVNSEMGRRGFHSAEVTTTDILGKSSSHTITEQREVESKFLNNMSLANVVRAMERLRPLPQE